jgi:hypothetical protein
MRWPRRFRSGPDEGSRPGHLRALAVYTAVFCASLLPRLVPVRPGRLLASSPSDGAIFLWALGWWPHALAHGGLPLYTHEVFAPGGTNLAWTTSIPTPGIALAPVTHLVGVFAAFNALAILGPVTAGWTTYLLVRRVTHRWWPSVFGGLVFALSPLEVTETSIGHLNLTLIALVPLAAYLVVRKLEGSIGPVAFVVSLGLVLAAQLGISTEVVATATVFGSVALLTLWALERDRRAVIGRTVGLVALAYLVAALLAAPLLFTAFARPHPPVVLGAAGTVSPAGRIGQQATPVRFAAGSGAISAQGEAPVAGAPRTAGTTAAPSAGGLPAWVVVGLQAPLAIVLCLLGWGRRKERAVQAMAIVALVSLACAVGMVKIGGTTLPTPWLALRHVPILGLALPQRLTVFFWLIAAVGAGAWFADRPASVWRWAAAGLILAAALPALWSGTWTSTIPSPAFAIRGPGNILDGRNVFVVAGPPPGPVQLQDVAFPTVWQAEAGFSYRLADAYVGTFHPELPTAVRRLVYGRPVHAGDPGVIRSWLRRAGVGVILVARPDPAAVIRVRALVGIRPVVVDGVTVFRLG